jgi:hypothetical protein
MGPQRNWSVSEGPSDSEFTGESGAVFEKSSSLKGGIG